MKKIFGKKTESQPTDYSAVLELDTGQTDLAPGLQNLYSPQATTQTRIRDIADILCEQQLLSGEQLEHIHEQHRNSGTDIETLVAEQGIEIDQILQAKASLYGYEFRTVTPEQIDHKAFALLDIKYIQTNQIMPISIDEDGVLLVATTRPANVFAIDDVKRQTGRAVDVVVCRLEDIEAACEEYDDSKFDYNVDDLMTEMDDIELIEDDEEDVEDLEKSAGESPVIKFVNFLLSNALHEGASDIHIEPKEKYTKIRYRIDGILFETKQAPSRMHAAIVSRLKIMANLDISERRVPQDGKIAVIMGGRGVDLRVSVLPTSHGEKVVIRLLDSKSIMIGLEDSGMQPRILEAFREQIVQPHGILLVTGPTGSGKSTTLYSALAQMDSERLNVSTVEDPVEYNLEYCNQVQVNEKTGLTFSGALRSLLRQDPDIIMVGEIRDQETARIAVQAALTGHLVLSTLHTNDAPSTIARLLDLGLETFLITATLEGIVAQRLVRKICHNCKTEYEPTEEMLMELELTPEDVRGKRFFYGKGCNNCNGTGYRGRTGLYEIMVFNDELRDLVMNSASTAVLRDAARKAGMKTLRENGLKAIFDGITTLEEVVRETIVAEEE